MKRKIFVSALIAVFIVVAFIGYRSLPRKHKFFRHKVKVSAKSQRDKFWRAAKSEVDKSVAELAAQNQKEKEKGILFPKFIRGNPAKKQIAITFDDGPHPKFTPRLLSILKKYNTKATFFLVGEMAERYPALVSAEVAAGHSIGNHTYDHVDLTDIASEDAAIEIEAGGEVLSTLTEKKPLLFRPPGGDYNDDVAQIASKLGYTMVLWTVNAEDCKSPGENSIEKRVLSKVSNGGIILFHDGIPQTMDMLPKLITTLREKGYQFVTIDQMMRDSGFNQSLKTKDFL